MQLWLILNVGSEKCVSSQGDLINWLDQMVRYLEAIEAMAKVLGRGEEEEQ